MYQKFRGVFCRVMVFLGTAIIYSFFNQRKQPYEKPSQDPFPSRCFFLRFYWGSPPNGSFPRLKYKFLSGLFAGGYGGYGESRLYLENVAGIQYNDGLVFRGDWRTAD